ncbi:MAG TPA: glycosyltransferase family 2 protein [Abditibacteriaceae bacterium]|jgi:glycosyltransferase involved in cell wall biosynthesis
MNSPRKLISVVTPCFNEEGNLEELAARIKAVFEALPQYDYEHILIDNASNDNSEAILRRLAAEDSRVKVIFNNRNFGHIRSPHHAVLEANGDAVIAIVSDLQDPPEMIVDYLQKWEEGWPIVLGQKTNSEESPLFFTLRKMYYRVVNRLSDAPLLENVTGAGLYDGQVIEMFRHIDDPYPYTRGLIGELGYPIARIPFAQPRRKRGISKNNFYTLFDMAMLGVTSHSKVPLRLATMLGFAMSALSFIAGVSYLLYKLFFWNSFTVGVAPLVIGLFFISSVQLMFLGVVGEYIGSIHTQVRRRPLVTERERINFDKEPRGATPFESHDALAHAQTAYENETVAATSAAERP